tara:strand:+ start:258 stop:764 length:507 start_codon:yes stop_codon:yes gene_type:complete
MYKHTDIHYEPQHPMLKMINLSQTEEFEEEENLGFEEVESGYFQASAACKPNKLKKPGMLAGKKTKEKYKKAQAKAEKCAKIEPGVEAALKRVPAETMKLLKGLNRTEKEAFERAIKDAAGGYDDKKSADDVLKALQGALTFKFANGKKKNARGKLVNNMIKIEIPAA